ncbi:hypothetical protein AMTR_s00002p00267440 [Amborella trichopoda]|uniref:RRM domain-containing protein n=1 Tax=Amborella trichopoda TaxID=13333 RepID=W1P0I3_AMBTC|nr:hypothetical protein AMTR_s00002p00267440 [Amborella trichopoda]
METTTSSQGKYIEFEDKVKRTVFLDNLLPKDTISVLTKALGQFGKVISIEFLPNYTQPRDNDQCALVEMENEKQAQGVITGLSDFPFMMTGMPRPVRARIAQAEMFSDRPNHPGQSTKSRWVSRFEPNFMVVKRLKHMIRRHEAEASFLL